MLFNCSWAFWSRTLRTCSWCGLGKMLFQITWSPCDLFTPTDAKGDFRALGTSIIVISISASYSPHGQWDFSTYLCPFIPYISLSKTEDILHRYRTPPYLFFYFLSKIIFIYWWHHCLCRNSKGKLLELWRYTERSQDWGSIYKDQLYDYILATTNET